jgi:cytochrome c-type biogenesis protein CcmH
MLLILLLGCLAGAALPPLVLPLLRRTWPDVEAGSFDRAVYRDQLRELDRDVARGLLTETEAVGARLEVQRRLLAAGNRPAAAAAGRSGRSPALAALVALFAVGGTVAVYAQLGPRGFRIHPTRPARQLPLRPPPTRRRHRRPVTRISSISTTWHRR